PSAAGALGACARAVSLEDSVTARRSSDDPAAQALLVRPFSVQNSPGVRRVTRDRCCTEETTMDVFERIKKQLAEHPVLLYMKCTPDFPQCGFSAQAVAALRAVGAEFAYVNVFEDPEIREGLKQYSNWPTYPQLYVNGELIGGCDITLELYQSGELAEIIKQAKAAASESA